MTQKRILRSIMSVFSLIFGALIILPFLPNTESKPEVKAVAEQPAYIPTNYNNIGDPYDLVLLPDGNIWYTDQLNGRIVKMSPTGEILRTVGRYGTDEGEFDGWLAGITRDSEGNLYVQTGN